MVILGGSLIHLFKYDAVPLQFDELLMYELISKNSYGQIILQLFSKEIQQPLMYLVTKWLGDQLGYESSIIRLPSLLLTLYLPLFFYPLARRFLEAEDALKATGLLALFYPVMLFSSSIRPYLPLLAVTILCMRAFVDYPKSRGLFWISVILLFFINPSGSVLAYVLALIISLRNPHDSKISLVVLGLLSLFGLWLFMTRWNDVVYVISGPVTADLVIQHMKRLSFLTSGKEFAFFLLFLIIMGGKRFGKKFSQQFYRLNLIWISASFLMAVLLYFISNNQLGARHFLVTLPSLAILTMDLIKASTPRKSLQHLFYALAVLLLIYQSIFKEKIHQEPWEIDSSGLAAKAIELSYPTRRIINCGNCLSFYIKEKRLDCAGGILEPEWFMGRNQIFVMIEMDYVQKYCGYHRIEEFYQIEESYPMKGGRVIKIVPRQALNQP